MGKKKNSENLQEEPLVLTPMKKTGIMMKFIFAILMALFCEIVALTAIEELQEVDGIRHYATDVVVMDVSQNDEYSYEADVERILSNADYDVKNEWYGDFIYSMDDNGISREDERFAQYWDVYDCYLAYQQYTLYSSYQAQGVDVDQEQMEEWYQTLTTIYARLQPGSIHYNHIKVWAKEVEELHLNQELTDLQTPEQQPQTTP
ncbi:MAG: hypothetical protein K6C69_07180 [Lachnospiraceae bacterium]|nr:hypothetical protein [Lachnospiraceae bacterium]